MKAVIDLEQKPQSGFIAFIEKNTVRIFINFTEHRYTEIDEDGHSQEVVSETQMECRSIDTENKDYGGIVDAIITDLYPVSTQYAALVNKQLADDPESDITDEKRAEYIADYNEFLSYRQTAKELARQICAELNF